MPVSLPPHNILSPFHLDTLAASVVRGDLLIGNSTPKWSRLAIGNANYVLGSDGTDVSWIQNSGTGLILRQTSPTLITPLLGTPTSGTLTNCTGLPEGGLSTTDITTNDVSTSKHGFFPKLTNTADSYMYQTGTNRLLPRIVKNSGTASSTTNSATEANLVAVQLPVLDANSKVIISVLWKFTGTAGTKTTLIRHSASSGDTSAGTVIAGNSATLNTTLSQHWPTIEFWNSNSVSAQIVPVLTTSIGQQNGQSNTANGAGSINTGTTSYINFNAFTANSGDTVQVVGYTVIVYQGV